MKRIIQVFSLAVLALLLSACGREQGHEAGPPKAARIEHAVTAPAGTRNDPYYWLRDDRRQDPEVLAYLEAENDWFERQMADLESLSAALEREMRERIPAADDSEFFTDDGFRYWTRHVAGGEYPVYMRQALVDGAPEQVLLDGNALAEGKDFFRIGGLDVSPDGRHMVWLQDIVGRRQYRMFVKDLTTGEITDTGLAGIASASWTANSDSVLFVENDPVTLRSFRVGRWWPGNARDVEILYQETDEAFYTSVGRTRSDRYNYVFLDSTEATEMRILDGADPAATLAVFLPRERGHLYSADHDGNAWIVRSNWQAPNFRIFRVAEDAHADRSRWTEIVAHRDDVFIHEFDPFERFLAIGERVDGLRRVRILDYAGDRSQVLEFDEAAYTAQLGRNPDSDTDTLQFAYTSMTTPRETWQIDMASGQRRQIDRLEVADGYDPADYLTWREWVPARDGARIPVSLVRHRDTPLDGSAPLYQYAYGSYGSTVDPAFSSERISLLDRGFVYAIAHIRGSQAMGREWYEQGRLLNKRNTFTDFIDVTRWLAGQGMIDDERVYAMGGSAGGLLMGAVANMAPQDYDAIVAHVPFVDVVTTMLDESIPLTTNEFDEWGNPVDPQYYDYMLGYSPYDNVAAQDYPALFVTTGLWDSQVQYWEPAKWVAQLRHWKTDDNPLLFRVNMQAGHGGASGRYRRLEERALEYAFILNRAGLAAR